MHFIFAAFRMYPFWAFPLAVIVAELGVYFRRKGAHPQWACWVAVAFLVITSVLWLVFRGDLNSDIWLKSVFGIRQ